MNSELTAAELNKQIVRMRKVIGQAKFRLSNRLIRRIKKLKKSDLPEKLKLHHERKVQRFMDEIQALKKIKPDEASKFALVNTKLLSEFKIDKNTAARDRALYKLVTENVVVEYVDEFREKFPNWHMEVPFHLQRLGLQYRLKKQANPNFVTLGKKSTNEKTINDDTVSKAEEEEEEEREKDEIAIFSQIPVSDVPLSERMKAEKKKHLKAKRKHEASASSKPNADAVIERIFIENEKMTEESDEHANELLLSVANVKGGDRSNQPDLNENSDDDSEELDDFFVIEKSSSKTSSSNIAKGVSSADNLFSTGTFTKNASDATLKPKAKLQKEAFQHQGVEEKKSNKQSIHPSWEAAKRKKQRESFHTKPLGKKLKFDT
ncbi:Serum response factor-binding protein 1 [Trichinella pseudospiralis]|uniref:Serum response factor-binding protein 1 n=1 Tax=Trichinella pseudospiralis TaxID=6337 RepID=A0A0V1DY79_TRIPS|nr:Serum response factor-binding protein 1 [Trichinella pseudospiralis]KRZ21339.1 Serum response factor-binding protein 1 [Trichinella pseudospiralis]KRZ27462.1 Serum response factor-binding protein 1 [Trichinella pseudospiralis]